MARRFLLLMAGLAHPPYLLLRRGKDLDQQCSGTKDDQFSHATADQDVLSPLCFKITFYASIHALPNVSLSSKRYFLSRATDVLRLDRCTSADIVPLARYECTYRFVKILPFRHEE